MVKYKIKNSQENKYKLIIILLVIFGILIAFYQPSWKCLEKDEVIISEHLGTKCNEFLGLIYWNCSSFNKTGEFSGETCYRQGLYCLDETKCIVVRHLGQYVKINE